MAVNGTIFFHPWTNIFFKLQSQKKQKNKRESSQNHFQKETTSATPQLFFACLWALQASASSPPTWPSGTRRKAKSEATWQSLSLPASCWCWDWWPSSSWLDTLVPSGSLRTSRPAATRSCVLEEDTVAAAAAAATAQLPPRPTAATPAPPADAPRRAAWSTSERVAWAG